MNKGQLIAAIEGRLGGKKAAADALEAVLDVIIREVAKGRKVGITGFGTFERAARAARTGRNPRTGASVKIKKTAVPKFKAGTAFRTVVAGASGWQTRRSKAGRRQVGTERPNALRHNDSVRLRWWTLTGCGPNVILKSGGARSPNSSGKGSGEHFPQEGKT